MTKQCPFHAWGGNSNPESIQAGVAWKAKAKFLNEKYSLSHSTQNSGKRWKETGNCGKAEQNKRTKMESTFMLTTAGAWTHPTSELCGLSRTPFKIAIHSHRRWNTAPTFEQLQRLGCITPFMVKDASWTVCCLVPEPAGENSGKSSDLRHTLGLSPIWPRVTSDSQNSPVKPIGLVLLAPFCS